MTKILQFRKNTDARLDALEENQQILLRTIQRLEQKVDAGHAELMDELAGMKSQLSYMQVAIARIEAKL